MSDEFEDISVEAESPVAGAGTETPVAVEASVEPMGAEVEATQINLAPADEGLKQNSQQVYLETHAPERASSAAPITAAGHAAKEAEAEAKKAEAMEHFSEQEKHAAARREWMERDHDFGGQKMSGHDLHKLVNAYANNPAMQDKLRDRLGKSGKSKEDVDNTMKKFDEYMKLLEKESKGEKLSGEEERRRLELQNDRDVSDAASQYRAIDKERGNELATSKTAAAQDAQVNESSEMRKLGVANLELQRVNATEAVSDVHTKFASMAASANMTGAAAAKAHFTGAPDMADDFGAVSGSKLVASNDAQPALGADVAVAMVAQAKTPPPKAAVDNSFG